MKRPIFQPGNLVIYRMRKRSPRPGPRAMAISPELHGEAYSYEVEKYWVVADSLDDGTIMLQTRRGKRHRVAAVDPNLRRASWWERLLYRRRFPQTDAAARAAIPVHPSGRMDPA